MNKSLLSANDVIKWIECSSIKGREDHFILQQVQTQEVIKSWRYSLFSHEWLDKNGKILDPKKMTEKEQKKREDILTKIKEGKPLEYPLLGLGLYDNLEIGSGRATFLTLSSEGYRILPVYFPKSCLEDFAKVLA